MPNGKYEDNLYKTSDVFGATILYINGHSFSTVVLPDSANFKYRNLMEFHFTISDELKQLVEEIGMGNVEGNFLIFWRASRQLMKMAKNGG